MGRRRGDREFAELPPGTAEIRISADHALTLEYVEKLFSRDEGIILVKGPDHYSGGRAYITVQVSVFVEK